MDRDTMLWTKFELRRSMRDRLRAIPASQLQEWSMEVAAMLQRRGPLWERKGVVAMFGGLRDEPDLISFFLPWAREQGWRTALFAIEGPDLLPFEVRTSADLERGPLGAWVPVRRPEHAISLTEE